MSFSSKLTTKFWPNRYTFEEIFWVLLPIFPFILTIILIFFRVTPDRWRTFFKKIYTLAPSISTFIQMFLRNCQLGIAIFSGKQSGYWWNSVLIKSLPMLSLTSTDREFQPWHFFCCWCISICFYHWLPSHMFCILVIHGTYFSAFWAGLCASSIFRVLFVPWRHQDGCICRTRLWLESNSEWETIFVCSCRALSVKVARPHQGLVTTQEIIYNNYSEQKNSAMYNA